MVNNHMLSFISWYKTTKEGNNSNYIVKNFKGDEDQFLINLVNYTIKFVVSFGYNPFEVTNGDLQGLIKKIEENLYSNNLDSEFLKYSESIGNHIPRALLGKKNYLKYLSSICEQNDFKPFSQENLEFKPKTKSQVYLKDELFAKFYFRLITQDRFYDFLYFPISVLKKLFYNVFNESDFFDKWIASQINSMLIHTDKGLLKFEDIKKIEIVDEEVFVTDKNNIVLLVFTPIAGTDSLSKMKTGNIQNLVIDHVVPFESILKKLQSQLRILKGISYALVKYNDGFAIFNRNELVKPGNIVIEKVLFSPQNISDLKKELNLISSLVSLQIMDKKENLYKKKFD